MVQTEAQRKKELHLSNAWREIEYYSFTVLATIRSTWSVNNITSLTVIKLCYNYKVAFKNESRIDEF